MVRLSRTCSVCHKAIDLTCKYDGSYIKDKTSFVHCNCWVNRKTNLKRNALTQQQCEEYLKPMRKSTFEIVNTFYYEAKLKKWMGEFYNATSFPKTAYDKLETVYNGTYKSINKPIPVGDLYNMFVKQSENLKRINTDLVQRNAKQGKSSTAVMLFYYDLAVVISKYDSYLEWKSNIKQEQKHQKRIIQEQINYELVFNQSSNRQDNDVININDILDDI